MRIKELTKNYVGKSCIIEQDYKNNDSGVGHETIYIVNINSADWTSNDIGWYIDAQSVCHIERTPWFNEKRPFWDISISTSAFWSEKSSSDCHLEDADFEFMPKEDVIKRLKTRIEELMCSKPEKKEEINTSEIDLSHLISHEIKPKYIIRNDISGKQFNALDVNLSFNVISWMSFTRSVNIVYVDNTEHVKNVVNYDKLINNTTNPKLVYDLNDSFSVHKIEEDGTLTKLYELKALFATSIDQDYSTLECRFEWQGYLNMNSKEGLDFYSKYTKADEYAKSLKPKLF